MNLEKVTGYWPPVRLPFLQYVTLSDPNAPPGSLPKQDP